MKAKTIIGLALIVGFASLLLLSFGEQVGGYMTFDEAQAAGTEVHVVGDWAAEQPVQYDRAQNLFTFYMKDEAGAVRQVRYANPKPANFEDAEQIVVQGQIREGGAFHADNILVKCPSKYNDGQGIREARSAQETQPEARQQPAQPVSTP